MRKSIVAAVIAASAATSACGHSRSEDGGPTVARNYQVGGFDQIEVAGPYDVTVRTGSGPTVSARGPEKMLEHMVVEVKDGKLVIHAERNKSWFHSGWNFHGKVELAVTVPQLRGATIAGSGDIKVDQVKGDRFEGTVAGSGGIDVAAMDVQSLSLAIAGSGAAKAGKGKAQTLPDRATSTPKASRQPPPTCPSPGRAASRPTRLGPPTSASWGRATST
jgi:hypothetical protein